MPFFFQSFTRKRNRILTCMMAYSKLEISNLVGDVLNKGKAKKVVFYVRIKQSKATLLQGFGFHHDNAR